MRDFKFKTSRLGYNRPNTSAGHRVSSVLTGKKISNLQRNRGILWEKAWRAARQRPRRFDAPGTALGPVL